MKQSITKEQWDELSDKEKIKIMSFFDKSFLGDEENLTEGFYIPYKIGRLIEFLGDDWFTYLPTIGIAEGQHKSLGIEGLCDNLWEATKYKLNKLNENK